MKNYEAYYYDRITKSPHLLTSVHVALSNDMEKFVHWQRAVSADPKFMQAMETDRIVSWYNHLGKLQEGFQTNSVSFTLTALRILYQILEVMPNETNLLNLAPTIFEMISRPHANIHVTDDALALYRALSQMAHNSEVAPLLNRQGVQLMIDRLKGGVYMKFMRAKVFGILRYVSDEYLAVLCKERHFLYKQVMDTAKDFYESTFPGKFETVENQLFNSWAIIVTRIMRISSTLMEDYFSFLNECVKEGLPWEYLKALTDGVEEVGLTANNSFGNVNDLLLLALELDEIDECLQLISIFNMDKNQIQAKHALPFLNLMQSKDKAVVLKAKDILVNKFPQMFRIHPEPLFKVFDQFLAVEKDLLFIMKNVDRELITANQVKLILEKLPKTPITYFQDVLTFLLNLPNELQKVLSKNENHDFAMNYLDILNQQDTKFILQGYQFLVKKYYLPWTLDAEQAKEFISRLKVIDDQAMPFIIQMTLQAIQTPERAAEILKDIEYPTSALSKFFSSSTAASLLADQDYLSFSIVFTFCLLEAGNFETYDIIIIPDSIDIMNFNDRMLFDVFQTAASSSYVEWRIFAVVLAKKFVEDDRMKAYAQSISNGLLQNLVLSLLPADEIKLKGKQDILQERLMEFSTLIMSLLVDLRSNWDEFKKIDISLLMADFPSLLKRKAIKDETMDYSKLFSSYLDLIEMELNTNAELSHIDTLPQLILEVPMSTSIQDDVIVKAIQISAKLLGSSSNEDAAKLLINILESKINDPSEVAEYAITCLQETHSIVTLSQVEVDRLLKIASKADGELRVEKILLALLEAKGLTLPVGILYEIIQVAEKLKSETVQQKLVEEIRLSKFDTEERIDVKSAIELIAHISRKQDHEIKGKVFEAVVNVLKASKWDLDISLTGLRIVQNESTSDAQMGEELISLMQSLKTLEDERKIEIMALGMQILRASFNNFKDSITNDQVQFIDTTVAAAQSLDISIMFGKHRENVLSPTPSMDFADEPTASRHNAATASTSMGINTETSTTTADKSDENPSEGQEDSKETEERLNMLTIFKDIIIVKGKEILAEFIKPVTSTSLIEPTTSSTTADTSSTPVISSTNVVIAPSAVVTSVLEVTNENKLNLGIAVGVPVGIIAFLATSFVLVRKCRKNKNSVVDYRMWFKK